MAQTRLKIFGPDHPDTAVSFVNLAKNFYWQRKYPQAVENHRLGLATRRKVLGNQAADTRQTMVDLGDALAALAGEHELAGRWDEAREARQEVVALRIERYGADDGRVADARQAVEDIDRVKKLSDADRAKLVEADAAYLSGAKLYTDESKYEAAASAVRTSLAGRKAILGDEHRKTLQSENLLANCLYAQKKYVEAEPLYQHVLDVRKRLLGQEHADTGLSYSNLAKDFYNQRQYAPAVAQHRSALAIRRKALGSDAYDTRQSMVDLADALAALAGEEETAGHWDAARAARADVLALRVERFGERDWHASEARLAAEETDKLATLGQAERDRLAKADQLHSKAADSYADDSDYAGATEAARQAWKERSAILGDESRKALKSENLLANCLFARAQYAEAEEHYQHEIDVQLRRLGPDHPDYATSLNNLASLYKAMGNYAKAEPLSKQVVAIRRRAYGEENADYASSLNNLAQLYYSMGQYDAAEPLLLEALATRKKVLGTESADYATSLNNLAYFHFSKGNYAKAEQLYLEALAIRKRVVGDQHSDYAINLNELASLYESMGDYAKAEPLLDEALAIRKKMVGENHPDYAATLSSLASLYYSKGDYARAEPLYERALAIRKQALGEEHRDYASSLNSLANLHYSMNDYARAEPLYLQVLAIRKKVLGERHPEYASSLNNLASLYQAMGDYARAEPLYLQSAALWRKAYGGDENPEKLNHPSYATSLNNLANLYQAQGDSAKAEPLYRQALEIRKQVLGPSHPDYSLSLNSLANLYYSRGDYAHAEPLFQEALSIRQQVLGPNHPDCAACLSNLARLYENRGEFALADPLALEALEITERHLELTSNVQSERQQLLMNQAVRSYLDTYLSISAETAPPADQVHGEVLRWKGAVWARQQSLRHWRQALADDPNLSDAEKQHSLDALAELETASRQLATLSRATPSPERAEQYRQQIADLSGKIESLQRELAQFERRLPHGPGPRADRFGRDCRVPAGRHGAGRSDRILALLPLARFAGQGGLATAVGGLRAAARSAGGATGAGLGDGDPRRGGFVARALRPRASRSRQRNPGPGRSGRRVAADGLGAAGPRAGRGQDGAHLSRRRAQPIALGGAAGRQTGHVSVGRGIRVCDRAGAAAVARAVGDPRPADRHGEESGVGLGGRRRLWNRGGGNDRSGRSGGRTGGGAGGAARGRGPALAEARRHADGNPGRARFVRQCRSGQAQPIAPQGQSHRAAGARSGPQMPLHALRHARLFCRRPAPLDDRRRIAGRRPQSAPRPALGPGAGRRQSAGRSEARRRHSDRAGGRRTRSERHGAGHALGLSNRSGKIDQRRGGLGPAAGLSDCRCPHGGGQLVAGRG